MLCFSYDRPFASLRNGRSGLSLRFPERPVGLSGPTPSGFQGLTALPPSREWIAFGQTVAYSRLEAVSSASPERHRASPVRAPSRRRASLWSSTASGNDSLRCRSVSGSAPLSPGSLSRRLMPPLATNLRRLVDGTRLSSALLRQTFRCAHGTGVPASPSASRRALRPLRASPSGDSRP